MVKTHRVPGEGRLVNYTGMKIAIRPEEQRDYDAIGEVNFLAFDGKSEARLVEKLRGSTDFIQKLSLVAVRYTKVVGHLLFSPIAIRAKTVAVSALALAPMAVHSEFQRQGIGPELLREGLNRCRILGHKVVVVVGHPSYYPRFGFTSAKTMGLEAPFAVPDEAFMALELIAGALDGISGMVTYPPAFEEVSRR
jgi:putative acetyltransferase